MSSTAPLLCTNCGAHLTVDGSVQAVTCAYCGTQTLVPEEIWLRFHPPAPIVPPPMQIAPPPAPKSNLGLILGIFGAAIALVMMGVLAFALTASPKNPVAKIGEECDGRKAACSDDGKAELLCGTDDKMVVFGTCKGPNGCRPNTDRTSIICDTTYAEPKDPCEAADDACELDHKAELRCQGGHYVVVATCKGPDGCTLTPKADGSGYTMSCDDHVADVGDPCFGSERTACSSDKKALLTCNAQRYAVDHVCKKGCTVKKLVGTGNKQMDCE